MGASRNTHTAPHWHNICRGWGAAIRFGMVIAYIIFLFFAFLLFTGRQKSPIVFLRTAAKGPPDGLPCAAGIVPIMHTLAQ